VFSSSGDSSGSFLANLIPIPDLLVCFRGRSSLAKEFSRFASFFSSRRLLAVIGSRATTSTRRERWSLAIWPTPSEILAFTSPFYFLLSRMNTFLFNDRASGLHNGR